MRARIISRNFAILSAGQVVSRLLAFAITIHLTRTLQAEGFGMIAFATSVLAYAALIVDCGFDAFGPIAVARSRVEVDMRVLVQNIVTLRVLLTAVGFVALALFAWLAPIENAMRTILLMYGIALITNALNLDWVFLGAERMRWVAIGEIVEQVILASGAFLVIHQPEHVTRMPLIYLLARSCGTAFLLFSYVNTYGRLKPALDLALLRRVLRESLPLAGTTVVGMFSHNFDLVLVGLWLGSASAGLYGAAYRVVWVPTILITAYHTALRPSLARGYLEGLKSVEGLLKRSMRLSAAFAIGVIVGGTLLAEDIVAFLFGRSYLEAVAPVRLLLGAFALLVMSRKYRLLLTCFNRQEVDFRIMATAAVLNVTANLLLVPRFGLRGAAVATLSSEVGILILNYLTVRLLIGHVPMGRYFLKPTLCALVMAAVIMLTPELHVLVRILLGGGAYSVLLLALRVVTIEEIRILAGSLRPVPIS